jgi:hypothetical protein
MSDGDGTKLEVRVIEPSIELGAADCDTYYSRRTLRHCAGSHQFECPISNQAGMESKITMLAKCAQNSIRYLAQPSL